MFVCFELFFHDKIEYLTVLKIISRFLSLPENLQRLQKRVIVLKGLIKQCSYVSLEIQLKSRKHFQI